MRKSALAAVTALLFTSNPAFAANEEAVTLINAFVVPVGKEDEAISFWEQAAEFMKKQPGYISTALHQAITPDAKFQLINIAKWESADAFKKAHLALSQESGIERVDGVVPSPALYSIVRSD
ncbi:antibiotic biosynthesis monooxygenase family protein [Roseibium polysiphoniae]|uniref:Antibiotic biosynthesis monooxygenase n=1 Tax=Roseibium polysiphoniae TaxID=2571221 RepID=A0ABR9C4A6_9HYPH|nr:antibiotic biosynthesis monooxygenase family protein [Roseibium polysiphoniae]MBD8874659.1 antibiotic biosynthesis monooxygenase [Roseibium polysiphoniae]